MINKQTTLDLNGPTLSFVKNPQSVEICSGLAATFTGIATATFPSQSPSNPSTNTGIITYRWYDQNGPLFDDANGVLVVGSGTTILTLLNNQFSKRLYLTADYLPSAYGLTGVAVTVGSARSTGNAINESISGETVNLNILPDLQITSEPISRFVNTNVNIVFSTEASLTDGTMDSISYQWQLNEQDISDGTFQVGTATRLSTAILTITDDSTGNKTQIKFSEVSLYSGFSAGRSYTITTNVDFNCKLSAIGAGGAGRIIEGSTKVSGSFGGLASGNFTFKVGKTYKLVVGGVGTQNGKGGFGGGGDSISQSLQSGRISTFNSGSGGGGYTGIFESSISQSNAILIAGGGGGVYTSSSYYDSNLDTFVNVRSGNGGGTTGTNTFTNSAGTQTRGGISNISGGFLDVSAGGSGSTGSVTTSGASLAGGYGFGSFYNQQTLRISDGYGTGGGGGYYGGAGTRSDNAGGGSGYIHPSLITNGSFSTSSSAESNGIFAIQSVTEILSVFVTISGSKTPNLTISSNSEGLHTVRCKINHPTACNTLSSSIFTRTVNFSVGLPRKIINLEKVNQTGGSSAALSSTNVLSEPFTLAAEAGDPAGTIYSFYAPETDIDVLVELYGCVGVSNGGYRGGEGGVSTIRMTLQKNVEYVVSALPQATGGAAVFLWRKSSLIASVGGGGNAGNGGNGGDGGGVNVAGGNGFGRGAGAGGRLYLPGTLPTTSGIFGSVSGQVAIYSEDSRASAPDGGRVLGCSKGGTAPGNSYWLNRGFSPCQDVGTVQLVNADGYIVPNTAFINRGHKFGYACRQTAGLGLNGGGNGANGATGGQGGNGGGGGGGGSGYTDGSVTIVSTRQGGHTGLAKVIIRNVA
jgi:Glycine rich protein